ncbi:MAG: Cyclic nucleotide-binding domain, partial [Solirubrobacteraceae bacterium]|nr:Cyclic nucleotide-binding domain [Solirubrobacteraceae bacterium]
MSPGSALEALAGASLFADLDDAECAETAGLLHPFRLASREVLCKQGASADRLYLPTAGRLAVHAARNGTVLPLTVSGPGSVLGESALSGTVGHAATVIALEPVTGYAL